MFARLCEIAVGCLLLASGALHAVQPYYFLHSVAVYQILPGFLVAFAVFLPYLELVLAACLFGRVFERGAVVMAFLLFLIFAVAQGSVLWRGLELSCGCFGFSETEVSLRTLAVPILCAIGCIAVLIGMRREIREQLNQSPLSTKSLLGDC